MRRTIDRHTPPRHPPLGRVLAVWAHPDDETYLAGGLLALAADAGDDPVVVSATDGERGFGDDPAWPVERARNVRRCEARAAMAILGVDDHRRLELPDGACHEVEARPAVERLTAIIDEVRPDTVLTFGPDGITGHPDHRAVSAWTTAAVRGARRTPRLLYAAVEQGHFDRWAAEEERLGVRIEGDGPVVAEAGDLAVHLRLGGALLDRKVAALRAMATQTAPLVTLLGEEGYADWVADEAFVEAVLESTAG
jgi:LmbE family N-acetylglucosaminyl deacetylase